MPNPPVTFQPSENHQQALERAGGLWGIEAGYWDIWGKRHETRPEVLRELLEAQGVTASSLESLNQALEERLWGEWDRLAPPVLVLSQSDGPFAVSVRIPGEQAAATLQVTLVREDGATRTSEHDSASLRVTATAELRSRQFVEKELPLEETPLGYHSLRLEAGDLRSDTQLIVTPGRAWMPETLQREHRRAGLNISLYGIRSNRSWGCGDFTDLARLSGWVAREIHGSFLALNPLHALHNRQPYNTSPYLPNSIYYGNFIYLDVDRIEDLAAAPAARRLRQSQAVTAEIRALNASEFVEYERVARLKKLFLKLAFREFLKARRSGGRRAAAFQAYLDREGDLLHRFAVYCALDEWIHRRHPDIWTWPDWPQELQDPESPATGEFALRHQRRVLFHKYVQWLFDGQLADAQQAARGAGLTIGLFHDLALATDRCGADLWAHRRFFVPGCRVGAPPDDFSPKGQDWSFPPPASAMHWEDGYRLFRQSIRAACRHGGALRIDHVMRLFRLYCIPPGREAREGTYVRERWRDLVPILALESVRHQVLVVGEDLGTVEPEVREILARFGILSYRLFYFERNEQGEPRRPAEYPKQALVSSTTHDLPTIAGFWQARDVEARREAGIFPDDNAYHAAVADRTREKQRLLDALFREGLLPDFVPRSAAGIPELTGELHNAVIGYLASTPSLLLALNQEDLTKETAQQNLPGTTHQYPNWRRKMRYSLEELETSPEVRDFVKMYRHWLDRSGRAEGV